MDSLFFFASKLFWALVSPASLLVIWIIATTLFLHFKHYQRALRSLYCLSVVVLLIGFLPIGQWLLMPLEHRFAVNPQLPEKVDGIVVLSGSELAKATKYWQQVQFNSSSERNIAFIDLARRYPQAQLVFTGGSANILDQDLKEADVAKQLYQQFNFDVSRVQFERDARNTAENAALSYQMVKPQPDQTWVLVTTAWHMPRSIGLFCQLGWSMVPYPVDYYTWGFDASDLRWAFAYKLKRLNMAAKEWIGLVAYYLTGKTPQLLPKGC